MIKVMVGTNTNRKEVVVPSTTTIKSLLDEHNINYSTNLVYLGGAVLTPADLDKTLADFGITESTFLTCAVKADGGR